MDAITKDLDDKREKKLITESEYFSLYEKIIQAQIAAVTAPKPDASRLGLEEFISETMQIRHAPWKASYIKALNFMQKVVVDDGEWQKGQKDIFINKAKRRCLSPSAVIIMSYILFVEDSAMGLKWLCKIIYLLTTDHLAATRYHNWTMFSMLPEDVKNHWAPMIEGLEVPLFPPGACDELNEAIMEEQFSLTRGGGLAGPKGGTIPRVYGKIFQISHEDPFSETGPTQRKEQICNTTMSDISLEMAHLHKQLEASQAKLQEVTRALWEERGAQPRHNGNRNTFNQKSMGAANEDFSNSRRRAEKKFVPSNQWRRDGEKRVDDNSFGDRGFGAARFEKANNSSKN